jgi:hypothetical protein
MNTCPSCAAEQTETSKFCSECGAALRPDFAETVAHGVEGGQPDSSVASSVSGSSHHGRFLPGTKVADRYRIVSLLGQGGMGEVYRSDDLKLGHTVALKFLPRDLADDSRRHEYFHSEVRLSRQISHPNVCRVYDIGEVEGQHFLSMEYIDGEDLKCLLRRIGRLPKDKGIQVAQQLCAGLAAAHDQGVLHRDLKPANIMIDGRGQVRITDFGLAKLVDEGQEREVIGTPAYMAPEQLARGETTIQSDLYSLGLILYEVFTGNSVHTTGTIPELLRAHEESSPSRPSALVEDMAPAVERSILRCLEKEPNDRPKSARAIAAALPGGDPLAAALAAGETPSPEMVAAAGETGRLSIRAGAGLMATVSLLLMALPFCASWIDSFKWERYRKNAPAILERDAEDWIENLTYGDPDADRVFGFTRRDDDMGLEFVYRQRQSPRTIDPVMRKFFGPQSWQVRADNPSVFEPGMVSLRLDASEQADAGKQLLEFLAVPDPWSRAPTQAVEPVQEWQPFFESVGLDIQDFQEIVDSEVPEGFRPPVYADRVSAWIERDSASRQPCIIMAALEGRPVYFRRVATGTSNTTSGFLLAPGSDVDYPEAVLLILAVTFSVILALRNLRLGKTDTKGGLRLVIFYLSVELVLGAIALRHVAEPGREFFLCANYLIFALARTLRVWLYYTALEPYVRRLWPDVLISWSRALAGRFRDPLVGRDLMIGCLYGIVFALATIPLERAQNTADVNAIQGGKFVLTRALELHQTGLRSAVYYLALLLLFRMLLRNTWLAAAAFTITGALGLSLRYGFGPDVLGLWIVHALWAAGVATLFIRFGLLSVAVSLIAVTLLNVIPQTADFGAWYAGGCKFALAMVFLTACYGFYTSTLAGRPFPIATDVRTS